jgi:DNA-binding response OmpR family regulator
MQPLEFAKLAPPASRTRVKVLVIDDARLIRALVRLVVTSSGEADVIEASSGEDGLDVARRELPDAILLDVLMPGLDGPATLRRMRSCPATAAIPVFFLTADTSSDAVQRLLDAGASGVLAKPFVPQELMAQIRGLVSRAA